MTLQELVDEIERQPAWQEHGVRAPHKPLTILYAIGQALAGNRISRFAEAEDKLTELLDRFGPPRAQQHPEQPVWRLRRYRGGPTTFWEVTGDTVDIEDAGGNPRIQRMRAGVSFGLSQEAAKLLCENPQHAIALAGMLAARIVPPTLHPELLAEVGIGDASDISGEIASLSLPGTSPDTIERARRTVTALVRSPAFLREVRAAYEGACAICALAPRLDNRHFGLEAAHIRWANSGGPDAVHNGLYLCRMHHHALDRGAIKIDEAMKVRISPRLERNPESDAVFASFEGKQIRLPSDPQQRPDQRMLEWHWKQVFKG